MTEATIVELDTVQLDHAEMLSRLSALVIDGTCAPAAGLRCDQCGSAGPAAAAVEFALEAGTLALCAHHVRQQLAGLCRAGATPLAVDAERLWFLELPRDQTPSTSPGAGHPDHTRPSPGDPASGHWGCACPEA